MPNPDAEVVDRGDEFVPSSVDVDEPEVNVPEPDVEVPEPEPEKKPDPEPAPRDEHGRFIPKTRFDEAVGKERLARENAERQVAELQEALRKQALSKTEADLLDQITALRTQKAQATLDGDAEKIVTLEAQIDALRDQISIQKSTDMTTRAKNEAREEIRLDTAIASLEATYPAFNPESEEFDQDLVDLVISAQQRLISVDRMPPSAALLEAARKVLRKIAAPASADPEPKKGLGAAKVADGRRKSQIDKNLDTLKKQPADGRDVGLDSDALGIKGNVDVSKLTYDEFEALPASMKAKLRGDMLS